MSKSHKNISSRNDATFLSVFPEESFEVRFPDRWGSIDDYRASWESETRESRKSENYGWTDTDDSGWYDPSPFDDWN